MQMTDTYLNPADAFDEAIKDGRLSADPASEIYAGDFMYMGTTSWGKHRFKNIETRDYLA